MPTPPSQADLPDPDEPGEPGELSQLGDLSGLGDLGGLMAQAAQMQEQLLAAQAEVAEQVVFGQSGGGAVRVEVSGSMEFRSVTIDRSAVDPDDVEMLQDLVLAALHDATHQVNALQAGLASGLGLGGLLG